MINEFLRYYNLPRELKTHKGDYGKVFVVAGCEGMTGAAMLCAESAIRAGAGLVYLFSPGKILPIYEVGCREAVKIKIGGDEDSFFEEKHVNAVAGLISQADKNAVVVIGPGLGANEQTKAFVRSLVDNIKSLNINIILDADALNAYKGYQIPNEMILTPHVAEFSRITGLEIKYINENRGQAVLASIQSLKGILVLKGNESIVADEQNFYTNNTGNPGMATGGSGDVLTGIIAGIISTAKANKEKKSLFELVCIGVYIHGLCGDLGTKKYGQRALKAGDLIEMLKEVHLYED